MYQNVETFIPDALFAGNQVPVITEGITVAKGQGVLVRGTVVGLLTAGGLAKKVDSSKTDGTQTAYAVLTDDVDTSGAVDVRTTVYVSGYFNAGALVFGGSDNAAKHKDTLRTLGIYLK